MILAVADALRSTFRTNDVTMRLGGDEFLIIVLGDESDTQKIVEYVRRKINKFNNTKNKEYTLSASIGYAQYNPQDGILNCINKADEKMYEEKHKKKANR